MERNIRYACVLAKDSGAKLTLIHVSTMPTVIAPGLAMDTRISVSSNSYQNILETMAQLQPNHLPVSAL